MLPLLSTLGASVTPLMATVLDDRHAGLGPSLTVTVTTRSMIGRLG